MKLLPRALAALLLVMAAGLSPGLTQTTLDKVSFGTNWVAEAEHGGFFQAVADGTYEKYGLDVKIVPGGPNENNRMLLIAGKLDFFMAANTLMSFDAVANDVPVVTVAAIFQKDPQVLLTHPEFKITKLEELKPFTLYVSKEGISSYFQWLKSEWIQRRQSEALHLQSAAVPGRQAQRDAGLCHVQTLRHREDGRVKARDHPARRLRLQQLFDPDRDAQRPDRQEARSGTALRRRLDHRLVPLSLRRQRGRERDDQEARSGDDG